MGWLLALLPLLALAHRDCLLSRGNTLNSERQLQSGDSCILCEPQCLSCQGANDGSCNGGHCSAKFYLEGGLCVACPPLCQECTRSQSCDSCIEGYYLSSGGCRECPQGSKLCSSSAVLECKVGYFYWEQGFSCRQCTLPNCMACLSASKCSACSEGYLLATASSTCLWCGVTGCLRCVSIGTCSACTPGYALSAGKCEKMSCKQSNCLECLQGECTTCQSDFYLLKGNCYFGGSLMCGLTLSPSYTSATFNSTLGNTLTDYGSCRSCSSWGSKADGSPSFCAPLPSRSVGRMVNFTVWSDHTVCQMPFITTSTPSLSYTYRLHIKPAYLAYVEMVSVVEGNSPVKIDVGAGCWKVNEQANSYPLGCDPLTNMTITNMTITNMTITNMTITKHRLTVRLMGQPTVLVLTLTSSSPLMVKQVASRMELCLTPGCLHCDSALSCLQCEDTFYLQDRECVRSCGDGYYLNQHMRMCARECLPGTYLHNSLSCVLCPSACTECSSASLCTKCSSGYFLSSEGKCGVNCLVGGKPSNWFPSPETSMCEACLSPCLTCTSASSCASCREGYLLETTHSCLMECPASYFSTLQRGSPMCLQCSGKCLTCQMEAGLCTSCPQGLFLQGGACLSQCPSGTYGHNTTCNPCSPPCLSCSSANNCTSCQLGVLVGWMGQCVEGCPVGAFLGANSSECQLCPQECLQCSSLTICTQCQSTLFLYNNTCVGKCPVGLQGAGQCQPCPYPCGLCEGTTTNFTCLDCVQDYAMWGSQCLAICPTAFFNNATSRKCEPCGTNCLTCDPLTALCSQCANGSSLVGGMCKGGCLNGTFPLGSTCQQCPSSCLTCSSTSECTSCPHSLLAMLPQCVEECPSGWVAVGGACVPCESPCLTCSALDVCLTCNSSTFLWTNGTCLSQTDCQQQMGFYAYNPTHKCLPCEPPCLECGARTGCRLCANGSILFETTCMSECPPSHYRMDSSTCSLCPDLCLECSSPDNCSLCRGGALRVDESCVEECPVSSFRTPENKCEPCVPPCLTCLNTQYCLSCLQPQLPAQPLILLYGACNSDCPSGFFLSTSGTSCQECALQCATCLNQTECLTCSKDFYLVGNSCVAGQLCGSGLYPNIRSNKCEKCEPPCVECSSLYRCNSCVAGYLLSGSSCTSSCPSGSNPQGDKCVPCSSLCANCLNATHCESCQPGAHLLRGPSSVTCVESCPGATFVDSALNTCEDCSAQCQVCTSKTDCSICQNGTYLYANTCVQKCPQSYYNGTMQVYGKNTGACLPCNNSCIECSNFSSCHSCISTYLIQETNASYCSGSCGEGSYPSPSLQCLPCQRGCKRCLSDVTCLACSQPYVLYSLSCLEKCPDNLYVDSASNNCRERHECVAYGLLIDDANKVCYGQKCPPLSYQKGNLCLSSCGDSYFSDFGGRCVLVGEDPDLYRFYIRAVPQDGYIQLILTFRHPMKQEWLPIFSNISLSPSASLSSSSRGALAEGRGRMLEQSPSFSIYPLSADNNALRYRIVANAAIQKPLSLDVKVFLGETVGVSWQYPLQNRESTYTLGPYLLQGDEIDYYNHRYSHTYVFAVVLVVISLVVSLVHLWGPCCTYILAPLWDFMQLLYLIDYLPVQWPMPARKFFQGFGISWLKWFSVDLHTFVFSPDKVYSNVGDMHLFRNIFCHIVILAFLLLLYALLKGITKWNRHQKNKNRHQNNKDRQPVQSKAEESVLSKDKEPVLSIVQESTLSKSKLRRISKWILKIIQATVYLSITNLFFFALLNSFYEEAHFRNPITFWYVLSAIVCILAGFGLMYLLYLQVTKATFDQGLNLDKKKLVILMPIYTYARKLFYLLFMGVYYKDAAFALCFTFIMGVFIWVLTYWFSPYHSMQRYVWTLVQEALQMAFLFFAFVYIANQEQLMAGGYYGLLIFLATATWVCGLVYPLSHIWVYYNMKQKVLNAFTSVTPGNPAEQQVEGTEHCCIQQPAYHRKKGNSSGSQSGSEEDQVDSEEAPGDLNLPSGISEDSVSSLNPKSHAAKGKEPKKGKKKTPTPEGEEEKKRVRLPKSRLIQGQTDHEGDESSQDGNRKKAFNQEYPVRLAKREVAAVQELKSYDLDDNWASEEDQVLEMKGKELAEKIQAQKQRIRKQMQRQ